MPAVDWPAEAIAACEQSCLDLQTALVDTEGRDPQQLAGLGPANAALALAAGHSLSSRFIVQLPLPHEFVSLWPSPYNFTESVLSDVHKVSKV